MSPRTARSAGFLALVVATGAIIAAMPARLREGHLHTQTARRLVAVVIDDTNMTSNDVDSVLDRFGKVRAALRDSDLVMIASTGYSSVATDAMNAPAMSKRLDQAADKIRTTLQSAALQQSSPLLTDQLYQSHVSLSTTNDVVSKMSRDTDDQKVLVFLKGRPLFDAFEALRRLAMARHQLPPAPPFGWHTERNDLSANIVVGELELVLQSAEQNGVGFLTLDAGGYATWKSDGSAFHALGIGS